MKFYIKHKKRKKKYYNYNNDDYLGFYKKSNFISFNSNSFSDTENSRSYAYEDGTDIGFTRRIQPKRLRGFFEDDRLSSGKTNNFSLWNVYNRSHGWLELPNLDQKQTNEKESGQYKHTSQLETLIDNILPSHDALSSLNSPIIKPLFGFNRLVPDYINYDPIQNFHINYDFNKQIIFDLNENNYAKPIKKYNFDELVDNKISEWGFQPKSTMDNAPQPASLFNKNYYDYNDFEGDKLVNSYLKGLEGPLNLEKGETLTIEKMPAYQKAIEDIELILHQAFPGLNQRNVANVFLGGINYNFQLEACDPNELITLAKIGSYVLNNTKSLGKFLLEGGKNFTRSVIDKTKSEGPKYIKDTAIGVSGLLNKTLNWGATVALAVSGFINAKKEELRKYYLGKIKNNLDIKNFATSVDSDVPFYKEQKQKLINELEKLKEVMTPEEYDDYLKKFEAESTKLRVRRIKWLADQAEEERKKAEEERKKAEEERKKAEEERKKAEEDEKKLKGLKKKVFEDLYKANEEQLQEIKKMMKKIDDDIEKGKKEDNLYKQLIIDIRNIRDKYLKDRNFKITNDQLYNITSFITNSNYLSSFYKDEAKERIEKDILEKIKFVSYKKELFGPVSQLDDEFAKFKEDIKQFEGDKDINIVLDKGNNIKKLFTSLDKLRVFDYINFKEYDYYYDILKRCSEIVGLNDNFDNWFWDYAKDNLVVENRTPLENYEKYVNSRTSKAGNIAILIAENILPAFLGAVPFETGEFVTKLRRIGEYFGEKLSDLSNRQLNSVRKNIIKLLFESISEDKISFKSSSKIKGKILKRNIKKFNFIMYNN